MTRRWNRSNACKILFLPFFFFFFFILGQLDETYPLPEPESSSYLNYVRGRNTNRRTSTLIGYSRSIDLTRRLSTSNVGNRNSNTLKIFSKEPWNHVLSHRKEKRTLSFPKRIILPWTRFSCPKTRYTRFKRYEKKKKEKFTTRHVGNGEDLRRGYRCEQKWAALSLFDPKERKNSVVVAGTVIR